MPGADAFPLAKSTPLSGELPPGQEGTDFFQCARGVLSLYSTVLNNSSRPVTAPHGSSKTPTRCPAAKPIGSA